jgi:hypothetical protein
VVARGSPALRAMLEALGGGDSCRPSPARSAGSPSSIDPSPGSASPPPNGSLALVPIWKGLERASAIAPTQEARGLPCRAHPEARAYLYPFSKRIPTAYWA